MRGLVRRVKIAARYKYRCRKSVVGRKSLHIFAPQLAEKNMMKKLFIGLVLALAPLAVFAQNGVLGKWKLSTGTAIVEVYQSGEVYNGRIVWLKNPTQADGTPAVDSKNPNEKLRSRKLMGLNMLSGLKKDGKEYTGGKIYDPANGKTYNCSMKVEGDVLKVRGSLDKKGLIGRTMDWFRQK